MTPKEEPLNCPHLLAFLQASREHFGLAGNDVAAASPRRASRASGEPLVSQALSYRKAIQSFLLAVSVGSFAAGPAAADDGCAAMEKSAAKASVSDKVPGKS